MIGQQNPRSSQHYSFFDKTDIKKSEQKKSSPRRSIPIKTGTCSDNPHVFLSHTPLSPTLCPSTAKKIVSSVAPCVRVPANKPFRVDPALQLLPSTRESYHNQKEKFEDEKRSVSRPSMSPSVCVTSVCSQDREEKKNVGKRGVKNRENAYRPTEGEMQDDDDAFCCRVYGK